MLAQEAKTILHQHAIQGDINDLECAIARFKVLQVRIPTLTTFLKTNSQNKRKSMVDEIFLQVKSLEAPLDHEILFTALRDLEAKWDKAKLSMVEVDSLAASLNLLVDISLERLKVLPLSLLVRMGRVQQFRSAKSMVSYHTPPSPTSAL